MIDLENMDFDKLVSLNNEYSEETDSYFFICYKNEFNDYKDLLDPDENPPLKTLKTKIKDVFWIDGSGKLHTDTFEGAKKKMIKKLSTPKAIKLMNLD